MRDYDSVPGSYQFLEGSFEEAKVISMEESLFGHLWAGGLLSDKGKMPERASIKIQKEWRKTHPKLLKFVFSLFYLFFLWQSLAINLYSLRLWLAES